MPKVVTRDEAWDILFDSNGFRKVVRECRRFASYNGIKPEKLRDELFLSEMQWCWRQLFDIENFWGFSRAPNNKYIIITKTQVVLDEDEE